MHVRSVQSVVRTTAQANFTLILYNSIFYGNKRHKTMFVTFYTRYAIHIYNFSHIQISRYLDRPILEVFIRIIEVE